MTGKRPLGRGWRRSRRHDVVFYTPWIGSIVSRGESLPPGGAETQILLLAKALARRGVRVAIVAFGDATKLPAQVEGVTIEARPPYRGSAGVGGKLLETLRIWEVLWRIPSEVIVHRGAGAELSVIGVFARLTRRRFVYSSANNADFDAQRLLPSYALASMHNLGARLADAIVVQTEEQVALCEAKFGRRPVLVKSLAPLAARQTAPPEAFLWVGRLNSYKRPLEYIELARALPEARFWMVGVPTPHHAGDRELMDKVRTQAAAVPNLERLPPRSHAEIGELMSRAVASVNTSDFEGMPNVLLEAWSRGIPALALTHDPGGVVRDHGLGSFAEGSPEKLVVLAREQWRTRHDRDEIARRCRDYVEMHHDPDRIAEQWLIVLSLTVRQTDAGG